MVPIRTLDYKGHQIRLFVWQAVNDRTFRGMYEIVAPHSPEPLQRGTIAGALPTASEAEEAALKSAREWIERAAKAP